MLLQAGRLWRRQIAAPEEHEGEGDDEGQGTKTPACSCRELSEADRAAKERRNSARRFDSKFREPEQRNSKMPYSARAKYRMLRLRISSCCALRDCLLISSAWWLTTSTCASRTSYAARITFEHAEASADLRGARRHAADFCARSTDSRPGSHAAFEAPWGYQRWLLCRRRIFARGVPKFSGTAGMVRRRTTRVHAYR